MGIFLILPLDVYKMFEDAFPPLDAIAGNKLLDSWSFLNLPLPSEIGISSKFICAMIDSISLFDEKKWDGWVLNLADGGNFGLIQHALHVSCILSICLAPNAEDVIRLMDYAVTQPISISMDKEAPRIKNFVSSNMLKVHPNSKLSRFLEYDVKPFPAKSLPQPQATPPLSDPQQKQSKNKRPATESPEDASPAKKQKRKATNGTQTKQAKQ